MPTPFTAATSHHSPGVAEDDPEVEAGPEHERAAVQADLGDGGGGKSLADSHQAPRHARQPLREGLYTPQVAAAVDRLTERRGD